MRRIVVLFLFLTTQLYSQQVFNVGLKEGFCTSQVSNDTYTGYHKMGFVGGMFANAKLKGTWSAGFEVFFIQKGSRDYSDYAKGDYEAYFLQMNYVEIPILFKYYIDQASIEFGPSIGILAKSREVRNIAGVEYLGGKGINTNEFCFNIGASYTFSSHFGFNLRYSNSLLPVRNLAPRGHKLYEGGQLNSVIALCLTYEFGKDGSVWK